MKFVLRADPEGRHFRFAPLGGETFQALVPEEERAGLPDSIVVRTEDGRFLTRSSAAIHLMLRMGGGWKAMGALLGLVPRGLRDLAYDGVARIRHYLFAKPPDVCPLVPRELRARFDP